ncbi:MAG: hypothetical protein ABWY11_00435 [Umezawaea sp.]
MKTREPGRTAIRVSPHRLDTTLFGRAGDTDRARIVHRAPEARIDLADVSSGPPAIARTELRRRPADERVAARPC